MTAIHRRAGAATLAALGLLAGGAALAAASLPTTPPIDAKLAKVTTLSRTVTPQPTSNKGFNGFQTVVVNAPTGRQIMQGFATLTGGNAASVVIRSTQSTASSYVVRLVFPGEQGTPGKLHVLVQMLPKS
jgi:hypothetical protein